MPLYTDKPVVFGMDEHDVEHRRQIAQYIDSMPLMFVGEVTLENATTTTVTIPNVTAEFEVMLQAKNSLGATLVGDAAGIYAVITLDTVTLTHTNAVGGEIFSIFVFGPSERSLVQ